MSAEPFDAFVRRVAPEHAHLILAERDRYRSLLDDIAHSPPVFDDERIGYVEVQIDRRTWEALKALDEGRAER